MDSFFSLYVDETSSTGNTSANPIVDLLTSSAAFPLPLLSDPKALHDQLDDPMLATSSAHDLILPPLPPLSPAYGATSGAVSLSGSDTASWQDMEAEDQQLWNRDSPTSDSSSPLPSPAATPDPIELVFPSLPSASPSAAVSNNHKQTNSDKSSQPTATRTRRLAARRATGTPSAPRPTSTTRSSSPDASDATSPVQKPKRVYKKITNLQEKMQRRRQRKAQVARDGRLRKKEYIHSLEEKVAQLTSRLQKQEAPQASDVRTALARIQRDLAPLPCEMLTMSCPVRDQTVSPAAAVHPSPVWQDLVDSVGLSASQQRRLASLQDTMRHSLSQLYQLQLQANFLASAIDGHMVARQSLLREARTVLNSAQNSALEAFIVENPLPPILDKLRK